MLYANKRWKVVDLQKRLYTVHCLAIGKPDELVTNIPVPKDLEGFIDGNNLELTIRHITERYQIVHADGKDDGIFLILSSEEDARLRAPIGQKNEVLYRTSLALVLEANNGDMFLLDRGPMADRPDTFYFVSDIYVDEVDECDLEYTGVCAGVNIPSRPDEWKLV